MGKVLTILLVIVILAGLIGWIFSRKSPLTGQKPAVLPHSKTPSSVTPTPAGKSSTNITVQSPIDNDSVGQSFQVTGSARVFENTVSYRVRKKTTNEVIVSGTTTADAKDAGQFGPFVITIMIPDSVQLQSGDLLQLEVFQASPKDGSDTDLVSIPLKFESQ